ncbi:hypothetical protein GNF18_05675 [Ligilactobacillus pobuzihii]|uniref:hypothetical protein n=1 Tax=Ligilactobacillus pobuzihii TaxID=449659 RepID=UPI0019D2F7EF|nr:hypothetical protein [Ligilactobacillus pobuzihii]MBN7274627.1 hypothetical protein [Ligilactobacillus pobuzihii]
MNNQHKFCPNCGNELFGTEKFCGKCGYDVSDITQKVSADKNSNEQTKHETELQDKEIEQDKAKDKSVVSNEPTKKHENKQLSGTTRRKNLEASRKEKRISRIVWTIGILIALIGFISGGIYNYTQKSQPVASSKTEKSQSKKPKKNNQKVKATKKEVYSTKINKVTVGGRREGTDWIIDGTTEAPDNSTMIAILPKKNTVDLSGDAYTSNIATNTTDGEGEGVAEVHDGEFQIEITPDSSAYYGKNGDNEAVKDNQDIKVKIVAIPDFNRNDGSVYGPLSEKVLSKVNKKGKITTLTTNHKQGEYYRNWGDDAGDESENDSSLDDSEDTYDDNSENDEEDSNDEELNDENVVNSPQEAIALAKSKYGDNNGDWDWTYLSSDDSDPEEDGYFVKAISKSSDTMTGTAKSVTVYPDGTIDEN